MDREFGSGSFGTWFSDEAGLPAYRYTCDQYQLPEELPLVNKDSVWGDYRNHWSQIGNDRIIGLTYNFGYVKIRQDEGGPKFVNDWDPERRQYAGGFGYFRDDESCLSTFYQEQEDFERIFGCGYFTKRVSDGRLGVEQTVFAPYGDDPALVSRVRVTNNTDHVVRGRWFEYWGTEQYQMSYRPLKYTYYTSARPDYHYYFRREFGRNFSRHFRGREDGARLDLRFDGYRYPERDEEHGIASIDEVNGLICPRVGDRNNFEDLTPPSLFLVKLDGDSSLSMRHASASFFANRDLLRPTGVDSDVDEGDPDSLIAVSELEIAPGQTAEISFLVGYLPENVDLDALVAKYRGHVDETFARTLDLWSKGQTTIELPEGDEDGWLTRELAWHNYFLRSCVTYDRALGGHILNQGCNYQYIVGNQVFVRDVAQHLMPLIYSDPGLARELIDYELRMVDSTGMIFGGITGDGVLVDDPRNTDGLPPHYVMSNAAGASVGEPREDGRPPMEQRYDDQELWPLWVVSEYVLATKDLGYLDEVKTGYFSLNNEPRKVLDILKLLFRYTRDEVGVGRHGLVRTLWNDWSRALHHKKGRPVPPEDARDASRIGESLFTSSLGAYCTEVFADLLHEIGDPMENEVRSYSDGLKKAINSVWNGRWVQRIWVSENYGFVGDRDEFFMEGQPWTLVSRTLPDDRAHTLIDNMRELVMDPSPIGAAKQRVAPDFDEPVNDGWVWWSLNGPLIWGMVPYDRDLAYKEYKKNSLANHADKYPDIWFGIWSADDNYTSFLGEFPGYTRFRDGVLENKRAYLEGHPEPFDRPDAINFPVGCVHPHAWPLYDAIRFLRPAFTAEGVRISPALPKERYRIWSNLIGYEQDEEGIGGHYRPVCSGEYRVTVDVSGMGRSFERLVVNGEERPVRVEGGEVSFVGTADDDLVWRLS
ncbi:GH36-type glycosyl hydrolase domain-containing protein [Thermophilibacter provencensis]|uniref:GH36-type glycosyl hydrolase domain-containing protein n=1 Tax=Thermophilibacter provencensis TaxID=1852386 RepID=UPI00094B4535|nr:hypothetical protein [Thermophilibacter provencensis]